MGSSSETYSLSGPGLQSDIRTLKLIDNGALFKAVDVLHDSIQFN